MSARYKDCFSSHAIMHSLLGLGLGILLSTYIAEVRLWWIGVGLIVIAVVADATRK